jgi:hypothetical protein
MFAFDEEPLTTTVWDAYRRASRAPRVPKAVVVGPGRLARMVLATLAAAARRLG